MKSTTVTAYLFPRGVHAHLQQVTTSVAAKIKSRDRLKTEVLRDNGWVHGRVTPVPQVNQG